MLIDPQFALAVVIALVSASAAFFAVKFGGAENTRLLQALHRRFDEFQKEVRDQVSGLRDTTTRHDERIKALKESQKFRLKTPPGGQDMFADEGDR